MRKVDPVKQEAKRRQIVEAAIACFARKGFHGTSTNDICAEAGMSPGNLFHYFPSKLALIATITEEYRAEYAERFVQMTQQDDVLTAIEALALDLMEQSRNPLEARISIELIAEGMRNSEVGKIYVDSDRQVKAGFVALLKRGIAKGQLDPSLHPEAAATWLIALADGTISRAQIDPDFSVYEHASMLLRLIRRFLSVSD